MDLARRYSNEQGITTMGTEFLILAMFETEDSLCHFLLSEYEITRDEIDGTDLVITTLELTNYLKEKGVKRFGMHAFLASNTVTNEYYPTLAKTLFESVEANTRVLVHK